MSLALKLGSWGSSDSLSAVQHDPIHSQSGRCPQELRSTSVWRLGVKRVFSQGVS